MSMTSRRANERIVAGLVSVSMTSRWAIARSVARLVCEHDKQMGDRTTDGLVSVNTARRSLIARTAVCLLSVSTVGGLVLLLLVVVMPMVPLQLCGADVADTDDATSAAIDGTIVFAL